ncbi:MAG: TonB-dependent receptor plug domain-containing protein, partial [Bacteroidales bacterium]|nr:TonB-dependent receptor plug domain-containing protein [Bacteroidales bacterium]
MKRLIISIGLALCALVSGFSQEVERTDTLREARIVADRVRRDRAATQTGLQRLDGSILRRGFALFNTPDIIKTLQMMPGVAGGTELMSGLYVHGGDGTDNLFLLDGVPLYQVSHLVGLFSSFNTDLTEEVNFYKSGFPARYGGRMSSVVDVRTREGSFQEYHGTFALGLIDGRIQVEGPIVKDKTSFNIGLRRTWSEVVSIPVLYYVNKKEFEDNGEGKSDKVNASYNFSDFNLKVTHKFSNDNRLSLNLYGGEDRLPITVKTASSTTDAGVEHWGYDSVRGRLQWGNILASLNWQYDITDRLYLETTAYRSKNKNIIGARLSMWDWDGKDVYYNIGEDVRAHTVTTGLTANAYFKPVEAHHIRFGALVQHKGYAPEREYLTESVGRSSDLKFSG